MSTTEVRLDANRQPIPAEANDAHLKAHEPAPQRELTFGEKAVGLSFNPSGDPKVESIKRRCADLIDELHTLRITSPTEASEVKRMLSLAITDVQTAQMWGVKAVTWRG